MLIGGKWVESASGEVLEVEDPAHRRPVAEDLHVVIAVGTLVERTLRATPGGTSFFENQRAWSPGGSDIIFDIFDQGAR